MAARARLGAAGALGIAARTRLGAAGALEITVRAPSASLALSTFAQAPSASLGRSKWPHEPARLRWGGRNRCSGPLGFAGVVEIAAQACSVGLAGELDSAAQASSEKAVRKQMEGPAPPLPPKEANKQIT